MITLVSGNKGLSMLKFRVIHVILTFMKPNMTNKLL